MKTTIFAIFLALLTSYCAVNAREAATYEALEEDQFVLVSHQDGSIVGLVQLASNQNLEYSFNGTTWNSMTKETSLSLYQGVSLYVRGNLTANNSKDDYTQFNITGSVSANGNINYLWNYQDINSPLKEYCGYHLFRDCNGLTSAPELPTTSLTKGCYRGMFRGCSNLSEASALPAMQLDTLCYQSMFYDCINLTTAPELPASKLAAVCYSSMFDGCTALVNAPKISATQMADSCCFKMFRGCTSLVSAPELSCTQLANSCYQYMFEKCTSLINAPILPATTLKPSCYAWMFHSCTSLTSAPVLPACELSTSCYQDMFSYCTNLTTVQNTLPATILADSCYWSMFHSCSSLTTAPTLPATTLKHSCYLCMFKNCTSLVTAPVLPAKILTPSCYIQMFWGCNNLTEIKCLATDISAELCLDNWVRGITTNGKFIKHHDMNSWPSGNDGIPTNWSTQSVEPYTIAFDANGGIIPENGNLGITPENQVSKLSSTHETGYVIVYKGEGKFNIMAHDCPLRQGYTFLGWYTDTYDGIQVYDAAGYYVVGDYWTDKGKWIGTSDLQLYAHWEESVDCTISYLDKDAEIVNNEVIKLHLPEAPIFSGFTFLKWVFVAGDVTDGLIIQAVYKTDDPTSAPEVYTNPANPAQKLIRNGNVYILTDDKTYTVTGQEVR